MGTGSLPGAPVRPHHLRTVKCPLAAPHTCSSGQKLASRFQGVLFCPPLNAVAPLSREETDGSAVFGVSAPAVVGGPCLLGTGTGRELPLRLHSAGTGGRQAACASLAEKLPPREGLFGRRFLSPLRSGSFPALRDGSGLFPGALLRLCCSAARALVSRGSRLRGFCAFSLRQG